MIIDTVILIPVYFIIFMAFYYPAAEWGQGDMLIATLQTNLVLFLALSLYFAGFWKLKGQTPGKMTVSIKIIKRDGSPVNFRWAMLRSAGLVTPVIITFIIAFLVGRFVTEALSYILYILISIVLLCHLLMITLDSKKQALHDKIAGTYVVKTIDAK